MIHKSTRPLETFSYLFQLLVIFKNERQLKTSLNSLRYLHFLAFSVAKGFPRPFTHYLSRFSGVCCFEYDWISRNDSVRSVLSEFLMCFTALEIKKHFMSDKTIILFLYLKKIAFPFLPLDYNDEWKHYNGESSFYIGTLIPCRNNRSIQLFPREPRAN